MPEIGKLSKKIRDELLLRDQEPERQAKIKLMAKILGFKYDEELKRVVGYEDTNQEICR